MAATKEAIVICLDIGINMKNNLDNSETDLHKALNCITMILQRKIFAELKDEVALVLFGSSNTVNDLADDGQYQNITVARSLALPDWDFLKYLESSIEPSKISADFIDAVIVSMDLLIKETKNKKFGDKRLILFSNFGGEFGDDQIDTIVSGMKSQNILLNIIGPDFDNSEKISPVQKKAKSLVESIVENLDGDYYTFNQALPALSFFQKRSIKPFPWKCLLQLGNDFSIPIVSFLKVKQCKPKQNWKTAYAKDETAELIKETTYHLNDDGQTEIEKDQIIEAYRYGTTLVPFSEEDKANMAYKSPGKELKILGFTKTENIPRHHYLGDCMYVVIPEKEDEAAGVALSAVIHALYETNMAAIVRYCYSARSSPRLAALFPNIKANYECLLMVFLPFNEDLRQYTFPSFTSNKKFKPTDEQMSAIDELITAMDLSKTGDDESEEALKPKLTFNPYIQRLYQCMYHRVLNSDDPLPEINPEISNYLKQNDQIVKRSKSAVEKLKKLFTLKEVKVKTSEKTGALLFQKDDDAAPPSKRPKMIDDFDGGIDSLMDNVVKEVGTVNPVSDFWKMIECKDEDKFEDACHQMEKRIIQFVTDSFGSQLYEKSLNCLKCLREVGIKYNETNFFNNFLKDFRELLHQRNRNDFWNILIKEKLTLIQSSESSNSKVSSQEAALFLAEKVAHPQKEKADEMSEDEAEDLLDQL